MATDAFILDGVRTPVGRYGGSLSDILRGAGVPEDWIRVERFGPTR